MTDDILVCILSLLDPREATRTSVLSMRWRYVWAKVSNLSFGASSTLYTLWNPCPISNEYQAIQYDFEACKHVPCADQVVSLSDGTVGSTFTGVSVGATSTSSSVGSTFSDGTVVADSSTVSALPTGMESEVTSTLFETYRELLDALARHKTEHDSLLKKREILINGIKEISEFFKRNAIPNVGHALVEPFTELGAVNGKIRKLKLDYDEKVDMIQNIPSIFASESLLAMKSSYHFPWN